MCVWIKMKRNVACSVCVDERVRKGVENTRERKREKGKRESVRQRARALTYNKVLICFEYLCICLKIVFSQLFRSG